MPCVSLPLEKKMQVCDSTAPVYSLLQLDSLMFLITSYVMLHLIHTPRAYFNPFLMYSVVSNH